MPRTAASDNREMPFVAFLLMLQTDLNELIAQLENRSCAYSTQSHQVCQVRPFTERVTGALLGWLVSSHQQYECPHAAARCLEKLGPKAVEAVPALIGALREGPDDFDTGDGVIAVRSGVAAALAATRDPRAIPALAQALRDRPGRASRAIVNGLGSFGTAAAEHWEPVAALLRKRNADTAFGEGQREQFDRRLALDTAAEEIKRRSPDQTSFVIPEAEIRAAYAFIDRGSPKYLRDFEFYTVDHLAAAAARALGAMKRKEGADVLVESLRNPHAAADAAKALGQIGDGPDPVIAALEKGLLSSMLGPRAKSECARALGNLGSVRSVVLLRIALQQPELARAAAEALGSLGAPARAAAPDLLKAARLPSLAVRNDKGGLHWSVEAGERADIKRAAVRAIQSIDPARAPSLLAPLEPDPDVGWIIERARRRTARSR